MVSRQFSCRILTLWVFATSFCFMTDVSEAWNILVKNVSSTLDRNEVERSVVDPVVLTPAGFNRDKFDTASN